MARCPRAVWRPIPENWDQPYIDPVQAIDHSAWDGINTTTLFHWWNNPSSGGLESTFYVAGDGTIEQYLDTNVRADANNKANRQAVSIEAWDGAATFNGPQPYTPAQVESLIYLHRWLHEVHPKITRRIAPTWDAPGVGWHNRFPEWSVGGTACPGGPRQHQLVDVIYPAAFAQGGPMPEPAKPTKFIGWTKKGSKWAAKNIGPGQHAVMLYADDTSRHLSPADVAHNRFFGVGDLGELDDVWFEATTLKPRERFAGA